MEYKNPIPVAVTIVPVFQDGEIIGYLGIERAIEPFIGGLCFPGGYQDEGECFEQTAARELLEETGIQTSEGDWLLLYSAPANNNRVLVFLCLNYPIDAALVSSLKPNSEVTSFKIIDTTSVLCFPLHQTALSRVAFNYI